MLCVIQTFTYNKGMNKIRYLVFDLDDTLLKKNKIVSEYTVQTFRKAQAKGYKIVFNTSRSKQHSKQYADLLNVDYGIYSGGCQIVDRNGVEIFSRTIPSEKVKEITQFLSKNGYTISVQTKMSFYASDKGYKQQNAIWYDFKDGLNEEAFKILVACSDLNTVKNLAEKYDLEWQNYLGGMWNRLSLKGATKWNGILELLKIVNGTPEEVAAFGDDSGDMEMIQKSGLGVAMGNSREMVLEIAKNIAKTNDEDGCAHFIEDNLL